MTNKLLAYSVPSLRIMTTAGVLSVPVALWGHYGASWWLGSLVGYFVFGCLGIIVGFHRYLTHRSYKLDKWQEYVLATLGTLAGIGSPTAWVAMHHAHHRYADKPHDPHAPANGLWRMMMLDYGVIRIKGRNVLKMAQEPYYRFLHDYYNVVHAVFFATLWLCGGWPAVLFLYLLPIAYIAIASHSVNWFGHKVGYRNWNTPDLSTNVWWLAWLTWGDAWHNNHHRYPGRARFGGDRWWEFDLSWEIIKVIRRDKWRGS